MWTPSFIESNDCSTFSPRSTRGYVNGAHTSDYWPVSAAESVTLLLSATHSHATQLPHASRHAERNNRAEHVHRIPVYRTYTTIYRHFRIVPISLCVNRFISWSCVSRLWIASESETCADAFAQCGSRSIGSLRISSDHDDSSRWSSLVIVFRLCIMSQSKRTLLIVVNM